MPPLHVIAAVWGQAYTDLFLSVCLPNQLWPGNLPALDLTSCLYRIFTTRDAGRRIQSKGVFHRLSQLLPTEIVFVEEDGQATEKYGRMTACHRKALVDAGQAGAGLLFLSADVVFAEGSFATLQTYRERGVRAAMVPGLRLAKESFLIEFRPEHPYRASELVEVALGHLHQSTRSRFVDSPAFNINPGNLYWRTATGAILARCLHLHPVFLWPARYDVMPKTTIDRHFVMNVCPDLGSVRIPVDSDDLVMLELTPAAERVGMKGAQKFSILDAAHFAQTACDPYHRWYVTHSIWIHSRPRTADWELTERQADRTVAAILRLARWPVLPLLVSGRRSLRRQAELARRTLRRLSKYRRRSIEWTTVSGRRLVKWAWSRWRWKRATGSPSSSATIRTSSSSDGIGTPNRHE